MRVLDLDPVTEHDRMRGLVGSQLQSAALPDRLRVAEAVRLFGGRDRDDLLEQFGLVERRRAAFASLSGGERQRLFLVLSLLNEPRLVILDELTQGLDPAARRGVWAAIDRLRASGTTVLLVTHELDEAEQLCDRVVAMRAGRVLDAGSPTELVDRHGRSTTIRFTPADCQCIAPQRIGALPGVRRVDVAARQVTVHGERQAIAHVAAALLEWGPVPPDLSVHVPSLEDALVGLLEEAGDEEQVEEAARPEPELTGAVK